MAASSSQWGDTIGIYTVSGWTRGSRHRRHHAIVLETRTSSRAIWCLFGSELSVLAPLAVGYEPGT